MDGPSLSIIIPIIEMGLKSRDSEIKRLSCHVMGGLCKTLKNVNDL